MPKSNTHHKKLKKVKSKSNKINQKQKQIQNQNQNQHEKKQKQINNLKITTLKQQIKQYLDTTKSKDENEKLTKCRNFFNIYKLNKQQRDLTYNWMISIWFSGKNKVDSKTKKKKKKWLKTKNKKKIKKLIYKQNNKIKIQQNVEKDISNFPKSKKSPNSQNIQTQTDINMDNTNPTIQINELIAQIDKNTQSNYITTYISPINDITILFDTITYVNSETIFANWSDMIIQYETPKKEQENEQKDIQANQNKHQKHLNDNENKENKINQTNTHKSSFYNFENTSNNYAIVNQININKTNNNNITINVWQIKTTTIKEQNNAFTQVSISNALQKEWEFHYALNNHWYQQHLAQKNLSISYKILINYNSTNSITLIWAFRTHNLPFGPSVSKSKSKQTHHQWRKNFIKHILTQIQLTVKNNTWLSTIIYYHTMEEIHNISKWNSIILLNQLAINIPNKYNKPKYRKAILLFVKQYFNINKLNFETTLDKIYKAQNTSSTTKIKQNQKQFKTAFNTIRKHLNYKIPNENEQTTIQTKLGFDPNNMPQRKLLNDADYQLINEIIPQLPKLQPTNLALGYTPSKAEEEICTLGPKFVPQPKTKNINFFEIHNGLTRTFNQIKFRMIQCLEYILNLNAIPKEIFTQKMPVISKKHKKHDRIYKSLQPLKNNTIQNKLNDLKKIIFISRKYLTEEEKSNLTKTQIQALTLMEKQSILAHVKQDKGSEFVREWMIFILWKIEKIINKCNLVPITEENVDWLIPNDIQSTHKVLQEIDRLGAVSYLQYKQNFARIRQIPYTTYETNVTYKHFSNINMDDNINSNIKNIDKSNNNVNNINVSPNEKIIIDENDNTVTIPNNNNNSINCNSDSNSDIDISINNNNNNTDSSIENENENPVLINKQSLILNPVLNVINNSNTIENTTLSNFDISNELKYSNLQQYVLNKQSNLIAEWINKYINKIPCEWIDIISQRITDITKPGTISATVKEHKKVKKTRLIQAIIRQPKEYLSAFVQMYAQQAHKQYNHHTIKDSQTVCRMIDKVNKKYKRNKEFWKKQFAMSDDVVGFYPSLSHGAIFINSNNMLTKWEKESQENYPEKISKLKDKNVIIAKIEDEEHIIPTQALRDAITIILKCHVTEFQQQLYIQTSGTPEGDKPSPDFAMITAKPYDDKMFEILKDRLIISGRYIDDGLRIGQISKDLAQYSINEINKLNPNVQFTFEYGDWGGKRIHFLDLYIIITPVGIVTEMYYKPTQLFSYLRVHSAHPKSTWLSVIKGLATNLRSHCNNGTINLHIRIQAAILKRQGYNIQTVFKEFNKIAAKSQNDTLYKHTNYYNFQFLNNKLFYENYEIQQQSQDTQSKYQAINDNNVILYKINEDMYKLRKNDPRIINFVVPYHQSMEKLKEIVRKWHESLLLEIPTLAAALPIGSIRLVQKRLANLKERLAPKYTQERVYYGNISCPINCDWFTDLKCSLCKQKMKEKYKVNSIHIQSTEASNAINNINDNSKNSKHSSIITWSKLTQDTNLTDNKENKDNNFDLNNETYFSQKHTNQNMLTIIENQYYHKNQRFRSQIQIQHINNQLWNKYQYNVPNQLQNLLQLKELIQLMTITVYVYKFKDRNDNTKLNITIIRSPWTYNEALKSELNLHQLSNSVRNAINKFEKYHNIKYQNQNKTFWEIRPCRYEIRFAIQFWGTILKYQNNNHVSFTVQDTKDMIETKYCTYKVTNISCINIFEKYFIYNFVIINHKQTHKIIITNKVKKINQNLVCQTPNVIYKSTINLSLIGGPIKQYIGSTRKTLAHRASQTNSAIRNGKMGNGMTSFCVHYCNQNKINREDIITYITYEVLETVKYTTYPIIDEQLLFQAERRHILENQTCLHLVNDTTTVGVNSWDDVEQSSGMRKCTPAEIKKAAYMIKAKNATSGEKIEARQKMEETRQRRIKIDSPIYTKFDKIIEMYESMGIELTDPRRL